MRGLFSTLTSYLRRILSKSSGRSESVRTSVRTDGLATPGGMSILASSSSEEEPRERLNFFQDTTIECKDASKPSITFTECGHTGAESVEVNLWGRVEALSVRDEHIKDQGGIKTIEGECLQCSFEKAKNSAIRCCLCGYAIIPGDAVAAYRKSSPAINQEVATFVGDNALGCLLWDCCPTGGFFAGHWTAEGFRPAFDEGTAADSTFSSGQGMITRS